MGSKAVSGIVWKLLERFGAQGVTFVVSIILARLIEPEIYGTIALIMVITSILQVFVEGGFSNALVQKKDADDLDFSTVFYFNIAVCICLYIILYITAPLISAFYSAQITPVIRVLGVLVLVSGVKSIQVAYVSRNLLFKEFFLATLCGTIIAAIVGVWMAYAGCGIWAIVIQNLLNQFIDTLILWIVVKWRPKLIFSWSRFKAMFNYGWKFLASSLIDRIYLEIKSLIIGKKYSSADLAFFNRGEQFPKIIGESLNYSISAVLMPIMSRKQEDTEEVKRITRKAIRIGSFVTWPCMLGLAACSDTVIVLLLTDKWLQAAPFLIAFCFVYGLFPISTANLCAINALGRSDIFLRLEIIKKIVSTIILLISMWFGPIYIALGTIIASFISAFINARPNRDLIGYSYIEQVKDILPSLLLSVVMALLARLVTVLEINIVFQLFLQIILSMFFYFSVAYLLKFDSFSFIMEIVKSKLCVKIDNLK